MSADDLAELTDVDAALIRAARRWPDRPWVTCGDGMLTFAAADRRADEVAAGLAGLGVAPGDRVAVITPNRIEAVELFAGIGRLGAVGVPLNVFLKGEFLRHQLVDAGASVVVADAPGVRAVAALDAELPDLTHVVALDAPGDLADDLPAPLTGWDDLEPAAAPRPALVRATLHSIVYTSGTTGRPKGCMLPHGYYLASSAEGGRLQGYTTDDVVLTALPLYHGFARGALMSALLYGAHVVVEPAFSPAAFLARAREVSATVLQLVGAMAHALLAQPAEAGDAGDRLRMVTAIPLDPERSAAFEARFGGRVQSAVYGQTETGGIAMAPAGERAAPGTLGRPAPGFEVRVVDGDDREVPAGEVGEIVVRPHRPHAMFAGYWNRPDATAAAWRNLWHHTGDLARADADGTLTFVDRRSDALRRRGENISSVELEAALLGHPAIAEVAVHAVPSDATEDDVKACVVLGDGVGLTPESFFAHARDRVPYFAVPRYVEVLDELPRTATMRVQKHRLRARGVTPDTWDLEALGLTVERADRR